MASSSISITSFAGIIIIFILLQLLWSGYANGCFPSIISFGDSQSDTGNSKQLVSIYGPVVSYFNPPYGQDFINQSTGRLSNGRIIIDFLAEGLGLPLIPPFVRNESENAVDLGQGVNYAVAGATALDASVLEAIGIENLMTNASLGVQLAWLKRSLPSICGNASDCRNLIGRSLILIGAIGGNDYNSLILQGQPLEKVKSLVPPVIDSIISAVNELIEMGAETLVVPGHIPFGCSAAYLTIFGSEKEEYDPTTGCLVKQNEFVEYNNEFLQTKLNQIRELHSNVNIIYADYYNAAMEIYRSPYKFGFTNGALKACCGGGGPFNFDLSIDCGSASANVCDEPDTYVNWDGIHFTEAAYKIMSNNIFWGPYTTPRFDSLCPTSASESSVGILSSM